MKRTVTDISHVFALRAMQSGKAYHSSVRVPWIPFDRANVPFDVRRACATIVSHDESNPAEFPTGRRPHRT